MSIDSVIQQDYESMIQEDVHPLKKKEAIASFALPGEVGFDEGTSFRFVYQQERFPKDITSQDIHAAGSFPVYLVTLCLINASFERSTSCFVVFIFASLSVPSLQ